MSMNKNFSVRFRIIYSPQHTFNEISLRMGLLVLAGKPITAAEAMNCMTTHIERTPAARQTRWN